MYERENKDICRKMDTLDKVRELKINKRRKRKRTDYRKRQKKTESR
jgi:hypothetical protein